MKTIYKNQCNTPAMMQVLHLQTQMANACLQNGLAFRSTIAHNRYDVPSLSFQIAQNDGKADVFSGGIELDGMYQYERIMQYIRGEYVSELFPPAIERVAVGENFEKIDYWRRQAIMEYDVTGGIPIELSVTPQLFEKNRRRTEWVGYAYGDIEVCRCRDGDTNVGFEKIHSVTYVEEEGKGTVVKINFSTEKVDLENLHKPVVRAPNSSLKIRRQLEERETELTATLEKIKLPKVLSREEYDALSKEKQDAYFGACMDVARLVDAALTRKAPITVTSEMVVFVRQVLLSDLVDQEWRLKYVLVSQDLTTVNTRLYYTARVLKVSDSVLDDIAGPIDRYLSEDAAKELKAEIEMKEKGNSADVQQVEAKSKPRKTVTKAKPAATKARKAPAKRKTADEPKPGAISEDMTKSK